MLRITTISLMAGLVALSACTTNEPELPPTDPSTVITTVTANSRDRAINGLEARGTVVNDVGPCPEEGQVRDANGVCGDVVQ
ncbi:MAG: hypothetical protein WA921_14965 [Ahrensia sp.]